MTRVKECKEDFQISVIKFRCTPMTHHLQSTTSNEACIHKYTRENRNVYIYNIRVTYIFISYIYATLSKLLVFYLNDNTRSSIPEKVKTTTVQASINNPFLTPPSPQPVFEIYYFYKPRSSRNLEYLVVQESYTIL